MCEVVNSPLWKSLRVGLGKRERAKLLRELRKVYEADKSDFALNATCVSTAFMWDYSPQGWAFWNREHLAQIERHALPIAVSQ